MCCIKKIEGIFVQNVALPMPRRCQTNHWTGVWVVGATKVYKYGVRMCVLLMSHAIPNCNKRTIRFKDASWHDTLIKRAGQGQHTLERLLSTLQSWSSPLKDKAWRAGESTQSFNLCVLVSSFEILTAALSRSACKSQEHCVIALQCLLMISCAHVLMYGRQNTAHVPDL